MIDGVTVGATSTMVLDNNPYRWRVTLVNNSNEDMYVAPGPLAISTQGIALKADGGSMSDEPDNQDRMYLGAWHAICASGAKVLSVTELNRR